MALVRTAIAFSGIYFLELLVFGIGAFKEGGGRGFGYSFLAAVLVLWIGLLLIRRRDFTPKTGVFIAFAVALSLWIVPAWRVELAVERWEDEKIVGLQRRIEVSNVSDEPLLSSGGKPIGIRMKYSMRFPESGPHPAAPVLEAAHERVNKEAMRMEDAQITPPPVEMLKTAIPGTYARYRGGVDYAFVVNMVPRFLILSPDRTKSCISFIDANEKDVVTAGDAPTRFIVHLDGTDYGGYLGGAPRSTQNRYSLKAFYEGAVTSGAENRCVLDSQGYPQ